MIPTPDETAASLASALVRAGRAGGGQRIALSNGTASASVIPLMNRRAFMGTLAGGLVIEDPTLMIVNLEPSEATVVELKLDERTIKRWLSDPTEEARAENHHKWDRSND